MVTNDLDWTSSDCSTCHDLADKARKEGCELIRYPSARHPDALPNVAALACQALEKPDLIERQTWHLTPGPTRIRVQRQHPAVVMEFAVGTNGLELVN